MLPPCVGSVGPKNCARTHRTDFGRRQTNVRSAHLLEELTLFQQLSTIYTRNSKGETETKIYEINADIGNVNKAVLTYQFEYQ